MFPKVRRGVLTAHVRFCARMLEMTDPLTSGRGGLPIAALGAIPHPQQDAGKSQLVVASRSVAPSGLTRFY
jgi:hypothetical protein